MGEWEGGKVREEGGRWALGGVDLVLELWGKGGVGVGVKVSCIVCLKVFFGVCCTTVV